MRILFWNTHRNENINSVLCDIIAENNISVVVLAEYTANMELLINLLGVQGISMKQYSTVGCERIKIIGISSLYIEPQLQTDHSSIQIVDNDIILCCIHLNSQIYSDNDGKREIYIGQIISDILKTEDSLGTDNTIIVGDFNINPYDKSCISAACFHGLPIYDESKRKSRTVAGKEFLMFYNPMWNFLGDFKKPYGTYYKNSGDTVSTYWNIYDQVIIRPSLRERFIDDSLKILTKTESISLLDKNGHPEQSISDHLPIIFEIMEDNYE